MGVVQSPAEPKAEMEHTSKAKQVRLAAGLDNPDGEEHQPEGGASAPELPVLWS